LLSAQKDLAERTLRAEIEEYHPVLVMFATGTYVGDVINRTLGLTNGDWKQSSKRDADDDLWWREGSPAMLWSRHPQGATKDKTAFWIETARTQVGRHPTE
jgi:hypothetical protein